jgi:hypothetical protein
MKTGNSIPYIAAIQFQEATNLQPIRDSFHHGLKAKKHTQDLKFCSRGQKNRVGIRGKTTTHKIAN